MQVARNVAKERFEKAREITREHRAAMDTLCKKATPAAATDKPVRRSPRNNIENNPPPSQGPFKYMTSANVLDFFFI